MPPSCAVAYATWRRSPLGHDAHPVQTRIRAGRDHPGQPVILYRLEARRGGVRILDDREQQVAMIEVPPGADLRRTLAAAGWRIVRGGSQMASQVLVERHK